MTDLDRAEILKKLELIGGQLKFLADPENWTGNHNRNALWIKTIIKPKLKMTRAAYAAIKKGAPIEQVLVKLKNKYLCGPEYLAICKILGHQPTNQSWIYKYIEE